MKIRKIFLAIPTITIFASISNVVYANSIKVQLGWGNITPCTRTVWRNDGIFGTPSPTVESAEQRVYAYAIVDAPNMGSVQNDIQQCALQGAAAAGVAAIISSPAGAMPAFQAQFESCIRSRAINYLGLQLGVSAGQCMW